MDDNKTPQQGIVNAYLKKAERGDKMNNSEKLNFRQSLEWIIDNEKDTEILAWAYNLRGNVHAGRWPQLTN